MQVFTNGYGEQTIFWQVGDRALYTSQKHPDLAPYEVTITAVYSQYHNGHPMYLDHGEGWRMWEDYSECLKDS